MRHSRVVVTGILDRELIVVTGKGGVGRSMIAAGLGLAAAGQNRSAVICESAAQTSIPQIFGHQPPPADSFVGLADGLAAMSIDPDIALRDWIGSQVGGAVSRVLGSSRSFGQFTNVVPGLRELLTVTKAWELGSGRRWQRGARGYSTVVLDAPATGHGIAMLRSPRTFADLAAAGPIHNDAEKVWQLLCDPQRSAIVAVSLPSELPVAETLDLDRWLLETLGRRLDAIVINRCEPDRFSSKDTTLIAGAAEIGAVPSASAAVAIASRAARASQKPLIRDLTDESAALTAIVPEYSADTDPREIALRVGEILTDALG